MTFAHPLAFLGLIPLWGFILFLYFLRVRRSQALVTAAFLWPEQTESVRADAPFQKLQWSLLLILQLLLALLMILMLARPQFPQQGLLSQSTVFVVDASASMSAQDLSPSRFAYVVGQLENAIKSKPRTARIAIIEAGTSTRIASGLTSDETALIRGVRSLKGTDAENDMGEALRLASAIARNQPGAKIVLLSDGVFRDISDFSSGGVPVSFAPVGGVTPNARFEAFAAGSTSQGSGLLISVKGDYAKPVEFPLEVLADGSLLTSLTVSLKPGSNWSRTIPLKREVKLLEGRLLVKDGLASDNKAFSLGPDLRSIKALLVSPGNVFLERAFSLDPRVVLYRTSALPESVKGKGESDYDLVVFDGVKEEPVKAPFALVLGRPMTGGGITDLGSTKSFQWTSSEKSPLTEGSSWQEVFVESGRLVKAGPGAKTLVHHSQGALMVESSMGGTRRLILPFNLLDSDLPLQPAFPILISNVVAWASAQGQREGGSAVILKPNDPWALPGWTRGTLFEPSGERRDLASSTGSLRISASGRVGWRKVRDGEKTATAGVALINSSESTLTPGNPRLGSAAGSSKAVAERRFGEGWRWVALLALALLCLEWWVYARRS